MTLNVHLASSLRTVGMYLYLLYRYWWNTRIFPFTKKWYLHRAQWRYYFYLSRVRILVSPWLLTWLANYKRASRSIILYYCLYFSFITLCPSFITFLYDRHFAMGDHFWIALFCCFENEKKSCVLRRNFISIYKINRTLHGRLGIRILSSRAESISHSWEILSALKVVSPRGHVISSI